MAVVLAAFTFTFTALHNLLGHFPQLDFQCLLELSVPETWEKDPITLETKLKKSTSRGL